MAHISDLLAAGRTCSFEFFPPKTDDAARALEQTIAELAPLDPSFISARSFADYDLAAAENVGVAPTYETSRSEVPQDDLRFSIEVSATRTLDEDIAKIFATLDEIDDAIGSPELQFSPDYPNLDVLRDVYFNRLTGKIKMKQLYEFFRWFDSSMGALIEKFIPSNTKFLGSNYVVEPHSLERSKFYYLQSGIYLGENDRRGLRGTIKLGQVVGTVRRI
jgi:hypothetical protein